MLDDDFAVARSDESWIELNSNGRSARRASTTRPPWIRADACPIAWPVIRCSCGAADVGRRGWNASRVRARSSCVSTSSFSMRGATGVCGRSRRHHHRRHVRRLPHRTFRVRSGKTAGRRPWRLAPTCRPDWSASPRFCNVESHGARRPRCARRSLRVQRQRSDRAQRERCISPPRRSLRRVGHTSRARSYGCASTAFHRRTAPPSPAPAACSQQHSTAFRSPRNPAMRCSSSGNAAGLGAVHLRIGAPPDPRRRIAVGRVLSRMESSCTMRATSPSKAYSASGAPQATSQSVRTVAGSSPIRKATWRRSSGCGRGAFMPYQGVPAGDEAIVDPPLHAAFVTNRERNGSGALTRVGFRRKRRCGDDRRYRRRHRARRRTADRLRRQCRRWHDRRGGRALVATFGAVFLPTDRVFSLAIRPDGDRFYAVSNTTATPPLRNAGGVIAIEPFPRPHIVARSAGLTFPIGIALDARAHRAFRQRRSERRRSTCSTRGRCVPRTRR